MGQAKRRGTYEQRKAEGIARKVREEQERLERIRERVEERRQREAERRAAMSEEEREREDRRSRRIGVFGAQAIAIAAMYGTGWNGDGMFD